MINARKILRNVKNLPHRGKMGLHSGSQMWLVDYVCEDGTGNIPLEVMHMCLRMYIGQGCENGKKTFELWLHDIYQNCGYRAQQRIGRKFDAMNSNLVDEIDSNVVIRMLKNKPKTILIDIEKLILDLDDIYDLETQRTIREGERSMIDQWIVVIALGENFTRKNTMLKTIDGDASEYVERKITYAAARVLEDVGAMHYIEGEHVQDGLIKVAVDSRYIGKDFSGNYEKFIAPYADCKRWNNQNPPERWIQFLSYDEKTGLCEAVKPAECPLKTDAIYNAAYASKRQQKQSGSREITPPVIDAADLNVEVPECLLN